MTQEDKNILLKDICARLPYGVKINHIIYNWEGTCINFNRKLESFAIEKDNGLCYDVPVEEARPYLRPMSSMTDKENEELKYVIELGLQALEGEEGHNTVSAAPAAFEIDFYNKHHFDYRGLIEKGLALETPDGMYDRQI